ncbi:MAG: AMP-binding protein [Steroidobacteraceae bacterium]
MESKARLIDCVAAYARERPQEPAIVALGAGGALVWSWERLWRECGRIATLLLALGVRPGECVAYQVPNRAEFVAITLGALRIGAVCAPLMPIFRERELAFALGRCGARVLFLLDSFRGRRPSAEVASLSPRPEHLEHVIVIERLAERLEGLPVDAAALEARRPSPDALAQLLFTSGTSGTPKGVLHRQDTLMRAVRLEIEHLGLTGRDRIYVPSPLAHQTGFLYGMWLALALGGPQILQEHWEPRRALDDMQRWGASFVQAATPFLLDLVQAVESGAEPPGALRVFVPTGAAVPRALARRAVETLQSAICGAFGTTEGCLATLASPEDAPEQAWGSDGRALPSIRIRVCDEAGRERPAGAEGHFEIASPTMFDGYLEDPSATAQAYTADGWYRTGDLATIDAAGYLRITGRVKDVINRGGEKIPVADIEQLLYQHEAVREAAIVAMPDARLGERACVFVAPRPGRALDLPSLKIFLDERRVAKQYWPERLELLEELPKTASGKIQKYILRERAKLLASASEES